MNPNQPGCQYPDKHLAGVGVAFKLAHALLEGTRKRAFGSGIFEDRRDRHCRRRYEIDRREHRAIVALGLRDLPNTKNYGLKALMEVADCRSDMTSYHIGFRIAPRINAAGRMDVAGLVVELSRSGRFWRAPGSLPAFSTAATASDNWCKRRSPSSPFSRLRELPSNGLLSSPATAGIAVSSASPHRGSPSGYIGRRSSYRSKTASPTEAARSIGNYHLLDALESCAELFEQFGGHAAAAGMKIKSANIGELRQRLQRARFAVSNRRGTRSGALYRRPGITRNA